MPANTNCLKTKVRNISGKTLFFGFLPTHGKKLADNEEFEFYGNLVEMVSRNPRLRDSLAEALGAGTLPATLVIVNTPLTHVFDLGTDQTYVLDSLNGTPISAEPCWGHYASSAG